MTRTLIALIVLTFALSACESSSNENNSNVAKPTQSSTPTPVTAPSAEPAASAKAELKAGDKVKVTIKGATVDATVVSVDEKAGKAVVRVQGEKEDKTVAIADIARQ